MYLRSQSQPEEEETGKEWKELGPIHFDRLPRIGLQEILWEFRDEDHSVPAHNSPPIYREIGKVSQPKAMLEQISKMLEEVCGDWGGGFTEKDTLQ